jgi:hypothetical protein
MEKEAMPAWKYIQDGNWLLVFKPEYSRGAVIKAKVFLASSPIGKAIIESTASALEQLKEIGALGEIS